VRSRLAIVVGIVLLFGGVGWSVIGVARMEDAALRGAREPVGVEAPVHPAVVAPAAVAEARPTLASVPATLDASLAARLAALEARLDAMEKRAEADRAVLAGAKSALDELAAERMKANETAAIAVSRNVISAQAQFQQMARSDVDGDRTGEYGGFLEMSGEVAGRMSTPLVPPVLSSAYRTLLANGEASRNGYLFRVYLADAHGRPVGEPVTGFTPGLVDANLSETTWCLYAWPEEYGRTGKRTFFTNQGGDVFATEFSGYGGAGSGPSGDAAFRDAGTIVGPVALGVPAADTHVWKQIN
jgi:hypothetical protein